MSGISLLGKNPKPSEADVAKGMQGNVCRLTFRRGRVRQRGVGRWRLSPIFNATGDRRRHMPLEKA